MCRACSPGREAAKRKWPRSLCLGTNRWSYHIPHCPALDRFFAKNRTSNHFVTWDAHVLQVVWPVSSFCNMCDLSAHARQVVWPRVPLTQHLILHPFCDWYILISKLKDRLTNHPDFAVAHCIVAHETWAELVRWKDKRVRQLRHSVSSRSIGRRAPSKCATAQGVGAILNNLTHLIYCWCPLTALTQPILRFWTANLGKK
jgi:hypothetical protein